MTEKNSERQDISQEQHRFSSLAEFYSESSMKALSESNWKLRQVQQKEFIEAYFTSNVRADIK